MTSTHKPECTKATPVFDCPFEPIFHTPFNPKNTPKQPKRHLKVCQPHNHKTFSDCEPSGLAPPNSLRGTQGFHIKFQPRLNRPLQFLEDSNRPVFAMNLLSSEEFVDFSPKKEVLLHNSTEVSPETPQHPMITLEESNEIWGDHKGDDDFDFSVRFGSDDECDFIDEESDLELFIEEEPAPAEKEFQALEQDLFDIEFDDLELIIEESSPSASNGDKNRPVARNLLAELEAAVEPDQIEPEVPNSLNCSIDSELERRVSKLNDSEILNLQEIRDRKKVTKSAPKMSDTADLEKEDQQLKQKIAKKTVDRLIKGLNICVSGVALESDISKGNKQLTRSLEFKVKPQRLPELS